MKTTTTEQIRTILWFKDIAVHHPNISRRFIAKFVGCHKEIVNKIFAKESYKDTSRLPYGFKTYNDIYVIAINSNGDVYNRIDGTLSNVVYKNNSAIFNFKFIYENNSIKFDVRDYVKHDYKIVKIDKMISSMFLDNEYTNYYNNILIPNCAKKKSTIDTTITNNSRRLSPEQVYIIKYVNELYIRDRNSISFNTLAKILNISRKVIYSIIKETKYKELGRLPAGYKTQDTNDTLAVNSTGDVFNRATGEYLTVRYYTKHPKGENLQYVSTIDSRQGYIKNEFYIKKILRIDLLIKDLFSNNEYDNYYNNILIPNCPDINTTIQKVNTSTIEKTIGSRTNTNTINTTRMNNTILNRIGELL